MRKFLYFSCITIVLAIFALSIESVWIWSTLGLSALIFLGLSIIFLDNLISSAKEIKYYTQKDGNT